LDNGDDIFENTLFSLLGAEYGKKLNDVILELAVQNPLATSLSLGGYEEPVLLSMAPKVESAPSTDVYDKKSSSRCMTAVFCLSEAIMIEFMKHDEEKTELFELESGDALIFPSSWTYTWKFYSALDDSDATVMVTCVLYK